MSRPKAVNPAIVALNAEIEAANARLRECRASYDLAVGVRDALETAMSKMRIAGPTPGAPKRAPRKRKEAPADLLDANAMRTDA